MAQGGGGAEETSKPTVVVEVEKSKTVGTGVGESEGATGGGGGEAEETLPPTVVVEVEKSKTVGTGVGESEGATGGGAEETLPPTVEELPSQAELDRIRKAKELAERVEAAKKKQMLQQRQPNLMQREKRKKLTTRPKDWLTPRLLLICWTNSRGKTEKGCKEF